MKQMKFIMKLEKEIRNTIKKLGGTMPENLPTPNKSLKEFERVRKREKNRKQTTS